MDIANTALKLRKRRLRLWLAGATCAAVALITTILLVVGPALPKADRASLWIDTVQQGQMLHEVRATGVLMPRSSRWLAASTTAQVEAILVWPGASVQADSVLMTLVNPEVEDNLRNAQALLAAAQADVAAKRAELQSKLLDERAALAQAQSDHASAKIRADINADAIRKNLIPRMEYEQGKIALSQLQNRVDVEQQRVDAFGTSMRAQLDATQAKLAQQQSNLELRQRQADGLSVRAGIAGVLQEVAVQEGAQVAAGANLARVARPDVLIARLQVPEVQAKDVAISMATRVDTHNGMVDGVVERIDPAVRTGSVQVDIRLTSALPPGARPDLSVDGRIRIATLANVLSVGRPAQARTNADITLFRLDPSGTATRVPVRIGALSADRVEIKHGLQAGDRVILSDTGSWDAYTRIAVH